MNYEQKYKDALERARKQKYDYQKELDKTDKSSQLAGILRAGISAIELAFPELRESEEERIRKELVEYHQQQYEKNRDQEIGLFHKDALAWLEKQKEQKPELPLMGGDTDTYFDDLRITTKPLTSREWFNEGMKYAQRLQKEQKPISFNVPHNPDDYEVVMQGNATGLKLKEQKPWKVGANAYFTPEQKAAEWSEEDEKNWKSYIERLESEYHKAPNVVLWDDINWLKSLHERLKSLRPSWKPSEEQMKHLERCFSHGYTVGLPNQHVLESLYNDLKKLM